MKSPGFSTSSVIREILGEEERNELLNRLVEIDPKWERIALGIDINWGGKRGEDHILHLINDTRGGKRQGFPSEVLVIILKLLAVHQKHYHIPVNNVWDETVW